MRRFPATLIVKDDGSMELEMFASEDVRDRLYGASFVQTSSLYDVLHFCLGEAARSAHGEQRETVEAPTENVVAKT